MDALLVMNLQNSFLSPSGSVYMGEKAEVLKVRLADFLSGFSRTKIFLREKHALEDSFFATDKTHSIVSTPDVEIENTLKKYASSFYDKTRYSALFNTSLETFLRQKRLNHIGLVGLETHTSILFTAEDLRNRGYEVTVVEPCVASRDDYLHSFAITLMRHTLGVRVTNG